LHPKGSAGNSSTKAALVLLQNQAQIQRAGSVRLHPQYRMQAVGYYGEYPSHHNATRNCSRNSGSGSETAPPSTPTIARTFSEMKWIHMGRICRCERLEDARDFTTECELQWAASARGEENCSFFMVTKRIIGGLKGARSVLFLFSSWSNGHYPWARHTTQQFL